MILRFCYFGILIVFLIGCQTGRTMNSIKLTDNEYLTTQEILRHVPAGSSVNDAKHLMEKNGFECSFEGDTKGTYLYCDIHKSMDPLVTRRWQVIIRYQNENVTSISVTTGVIGL